MLTKLALGTEEQYVQHAGSIIAACHKELSKRITCGVTTLEIERFTERFMLERGAFPAYKGRKGYPFAIYASVNGMLRGGFPGTAPLSSGDMVKIEMIAGVDGGAAEFAWTYAIGDPLPHARKLLRTAQHTLNRGIAEAKAGKSAGDIIVAIHTSAAKSGCLVMNSMPDIAVHGILQRLEQGEMRPVEQPEELLTEGMILTIDLIAGSGTLAGDTASVEPGLATAHVKHTVAVTRSGPVVLTK
ncbi:M24 family metallopeptidase [Paenibacillus sp. KS-LC4]|uniref:M24 family metallopeptidase n=1 Tax=Paenibacillus sp. KS-LC4 TaxID=2979727 RepID=UPI0030CAD98C